tara:strand:- start:137 stop:832 length:696 start_codon:yes stop_codon:yes gene_type:complete
MPANMKKSGMSYKKGGSKKMYGGTMKKKKMYGGTMKKKMYGGSKKKMMKKGSELGMMSINAKRDKNPDVTYTDIILAGKKNNAMYGGMANPNKDKMMMYGGAMYKKMMKMMGGPMMNEKGMKVPGMMKAGGGLNKMPGGGFMRDMDLPKAQIGTSLRKAGTALKNLFTKKKPNPNVIDNVNVKNTKFTGVNRYGTDVFKTGVDGNVNIKADNVRTKNFFEQFKKILGDKRK